MGKKKAGRPHGPVPWIKFGVSMPADILAAVDAARNGQTRSAWLVQAARDALGPLAVGHSSGPTLGQANLPGLAEAEALAAYSARVGGRLAE